MTERVRLQKVIARSGLAARRPAEEMIRGGRVSVNGQPAHLGQKIDPEVDTVAVDGIPLPVRPGLEYFLVNKPPGVVSTADDPQGRPTVVDLVPSQTRLYPVGRLDVDSEGLLLLTNDGDLTDLLTHPRHQVPKTYQVLVDGVPSGSDLKELEAGVELEDGPAAALSARLLDSTRDRAQVEIVMGEGRKREVRRMCDVLGYPVVRLFRSAIGPLRDPRLKSGAARPLTVDEVRSLYATARVG